MNYGKDDGDIFYFLISNNEDNNFSKICGNEGDENDGEGYDVDESCKK